MRLQWPIISRSNQRSYFYVIGTLQELLNFRGAKLKVDGDFGAKTEAAVKKIQRSHSLKADGIAGPKTLQKLIVRLQSGDKGRAVRVVQFALTGENGENEEEFKKEAGVFGFETEKAVREFQKGNGLKVDGIVGSQTWCVLLGGKVIKP